MSTFDIPTGALDRPWSAFMVRWPESERILVCNGCGVSVLVCGMVDGIDPASFLGGSCGCLEPVNAAEVAEQENAA